jgi:8-oxo-dGTP diphosphatase
MIRVTCAVIVEDGKVLCAKRSESMKMPLKWEFPGGKVEETETEQQSLVREIAEELSVLIAIEEKWPSVFHTYINGPQLELIPFKANIIQGKPVASEHERLEWYPFAQLRELDWAEADLPIVEYLLQAFS